MADYTSPALGTPGLAYDPNYDPIFSRRVEEAKKAEEERLRNLPISERPLGYVPPPPALPSSTLPPSGAAATQSAAIREIPVPPSAYTRTEELDNVEKAYNESGPGQLRAEIVNGKTVYTNQPGLGGTSTDYDAATAAFRREGAGTRITSPYDRNAYGTPTSSATTGVDRGGFIESQQDWGKVANPMGFEGFRETPTGNILAERAAELAKNQALTQDPYGETRLKGELAIRAAEAPARLERQFTLEDEKAYAQIAPQVLRELEQDAEYLALKKSNPTEAKAYAQEFIYRKVEAFKAARSRMTERIGAFG